MFRRISSAQHEWVKHLVKLRQNHDYRYEHQSLVIEGLKPINEVCRCQRPKKLIATDETILPVGVEADEVAIVTESVMEKISGMRTPEGLVAEIPMPKPASLRNKGHIIALEGIADPGNVGTLLRTALALGWDGAFILDESCDPFNEKALRAARGATFRLPLAWGKWDDLKLLIQENHLQPIVADLKGHRLQDLAVKNGVALLLGNEAHGASEQAKKLCQSVTIAMPGEMESLNVSVAGGIMMYALKAEK